jgi:allantoin racemase
MRLLVLNPNTSESMTAEIAAAARAVAADDTEIVARSPRFGTAEVDADPAGAVQAIVDEAARAVAEDGADVICLGCAGMAGVTAAIMAKLGVPAVDGVAAAVALAQALVGLGLSTSKAGVLAKGPDNPRSHWPLSTSLGLRP